MPELYVLAVQSSAGSSQAGATEVVQSGDNGRVGIGVVRGIFAEFLLRSIADVFEKPSCQL